MVQEENKSINSTKNDAFKNYRNNSSNNDLKCCLKYLQAILNASIAVEKKKYCHKRIRVKKYSEKFQSILLFIKSALE